MTDSHRPTPLPARPPEPTGAKPTPARELATEPAPSPPQPEPVEVAIEVEGSRWNVRILGRSGGAAGGSPPLMLLGFWTDGATDESPALESLVVATSLSALSDEVLREALSNASEPVPPDLKRTFFAEAGQGRRRSKGSG